MLNKLKRGVKYIIKKIKRGVELVTKNINDAKCVAAEVESKKLDLIRDAGSALCNGTKSVGSAIHEDVKSVIKSINKPEYKIIFGLALTAIGVIDKMKEV